MENEVFFLFVLFFIIVFYISYIDLTHFKDILRAVDLEKCHQAQEREEQKVGLHSIYNAYLIVTIM